MARLCPECNHQFADNHYGRLQCPDCLSELFSRADGVTVHQAPRPELTKDLNSTTPIYLIDSRNEVHIHCSVCGEDTFLSSARRILVGYFRTIYDEVTLDDGRLALIPRRVPRTWQADACGDCCQRYDDLIIHREDDGREPFLKL